MLQVKVRVSGNVEVIAEGETQADVFENLSRMQEVFGESKCGKCGGSDLQFITRTVDDNKYFELRCKAYLKEENKFCGAKLAYGQHKKGGGLFPKRKDDEDKYKGKNGWVRFNKETNKEE